MDPPGEFTTQGQEPGPVTDDPPGEKIASEKEEAPPEAQEQPPHRSGPQPFEIALARKLESKTPSVRDAFLLLDADGDGRISPSDVKTVLHNELGLDITDEQMEMMFDRSQKNGSGENENNDNKGMGFASFAKYYQEVTSATYPTSQSGLAAAVGFHTSNDPAQDHEMPIDLQPEQLLHQKRHQLRQLLTSHSSRESPGKVGMKDTSLFLAMDVHKSGKVTMQEMLSWANEWGTLGWTMEEFRDVVLVTADGDERKRLEEKWFGSAGGDDGEGEAGMTEHEFAEFVDSLDSE